MNFKSWLLEVGKSAGTADKYSTAVSGVISTWAIDAGLCTERLGDVHTVMELTDIEEGLQNVDIYIERNTRGKNMYSCALKTFIEYRRQESPEVLEQDVSNIIENDSISNTEKLTYISARVGQGRYRHNLIGYWERCSLTGFSDVRFLVASHIKPWHAADNVERLDTYNGLLLLPNIDKVFDLGFITFSDEGNIIVSDHLEETDILGIRRDMHLDLEDAHLGYMRYHREKMFERTIP